MSPNAKPDPSAEGGQSEKPYSRLDELRGGALKKGDCGSSPEQPPSWLDKEMFDRARDVFKRHFFSIFFCHLSGLMFIVHLPKMTETLLSTGHSSSVVCLFRRYLSTLVHIRRWYEGDIWNPDDPAHQSITLVRSMHRRVADRLNEESTSTCSSILGKDEEAKNLNSSSCSNGTASNRHSLAAFQEDKPSPFRKSNDSEKKCPMQTRSTSDSMAISQFDMALTQFAFVGLILSHPEHVGMRCSREELECLIHFWRGVGYMLGVEDRYNLCNGSLDETVAICKSIMESELKPSLLQASKESSSMSKGIIRAMNSFIIFLSWEAMARFWLERFGMPIEFPMGIYENVGYWLMRFTFGWLFRLQIFHSFFNFLLRIAVNEALDSKEYYENYLMKRHKLTSV